MRRYVGEVIIAELGLIRAFGLTRKKVLKNGKPFSTKPDCRRAAVSEFENRE
jgi:hypothetical protein